ncbi:hypothetical protein BDQ17DRAFT_1261288, partial [Cyathus striatus]
NIWNMLKHEKIHLQEIILHEPTESFMGYLKSYSGLKFLTIYSGFPGIESDMLALDFYLHALCMHTNSLEKLNISLSYDGKWCFSAHNMQILSELIHLRYLLITIIPDGDPLTAKKYDPAHLVVGFLFLFG